MEWQVEPCPSLPPAPCGRVCAFVRIRAHGRRLEVGANGDDRERWKSLILFYILWYRVHCFNEPTSRKIKQQQFFKTPISPRVTMGLGQSTP